VTGRGPRARRLARLELAIAIGMVGFVVLLFLAAPHFIGGIGAPSPAWSDLIVPVAVVGLTIGLLWMVRIYRSVQDAEAHESSFRSNR